MEKVKLTDICDFQGGSQPPKEEWSFDEQEGYIRMLQIRDFTQGERVTPEYIKISNTTKMCEANDFNCQIWSVYWKDPYRTCRSI